VETIDALVDLLGRSDRRQQNLKERSAQTHEPEPIQLSRMQRTRFAQPRALGLRVSDEFTVPLYNGHHDSLHNTGDERAWWARHGILDPLQMANRLWAASRTLRASLSPCDSYDWGSDFRATPVDRATKDASKRTTGRNKSVINKLIRQLIVQSSTIIRTLKYCAAE
jgi:hypothetical protein